MRAAIALLVAGIVTVTAGLSGASLAAEENGRTTPEADVAATEEVAGGEATAPEGAAPDAAGEGQGDRVPDEVDTAPVETARGDGGGRDGDRSDERGQKERSKRDRDKQPLADVGVDMVNIQFKPKKVTIDPGDEITWTNRDTAQHNAVGEGAADFDTGLLEKGENATVPFNDTGTFRYVCTVHPTMKGEVVVGSGGSGGSGGKGGTSSGTGGTSSGTAGGGSTFPSGSGSGGFSSGGSGSGSGSSGGSLPDTGQAEIPLLVLGSALIVLGLLAGAFREHWIWR